MMVQGQTMSLRLMMRVPLMKWQTGEEEEEGP